MWQKTPHFSQATTLMKFLAGKQGEQEWAHDAGYIPSRKDAKPLSGKQVFIKQVKYSHSWFFPPAFPDRALTPIGNDIQAVMSGKMSSSEALNDMQTQAKGAAASSITFLKGVTSSGMVLNSSLLALSSWGSYGNERSNAPEPSAIAARTGIRARLRASGGYRKEDVILGYVFILIPMVIFLTFNFGGMLFDFWVSFHRWAILDTPKFVGSGNYNYIFALTMSGGSRSRTRFSMPYSWSPSRRRLLLSWPRWSIKTSLEKFFGLRSTFRR
jgi:hypothetical protein